MKAAVLHGVNDLRWEEVATPRAGPGEVVIRVRAAGICGSDLPRVLGTAAHYYPIVLGHEFSGEVAEIGRGVEGLAAGQRVTAAPLVPCMVCENCQKGDYALCRQYEFIGSSRAGGFAEYVCVPARNVVTFDESVDFVQGAFFEPATVALHGLLQTGYRGGEDVAILGGGTIGLFTMQWARILGARRTVVFDLNPARLELALRMGADMVVNTAQPGALERAAALAGPQGYGFVLETAGQNATMELAFELAAPRAKVCFIGTSAADLQFGWKLFEQMNRKEFTLTGSWMSYSAPFPGREWLDTAACFAGGRLWFDNALVYRTFPMAQAAQAFALFKNGRVGGKVMLVNG